jgi:hypothetical protein
VVTPNIVAPTAGRLDGVGTAGPVTIPTTASAARASTGVLTEFSPAMSTTG